MRLVLLASSWRCISFRLLLYLGSTRCQHRVTYERGPTNADAQDTARYFAPSQRQHFMPMQSIVSLIIVG